MHVKVLAEKHQVVAKRSPKRGFQMISPSSIIINQKTKINGYITKGVGKISFLAVVGVPSWVV